MIRGGGMSRVDVSDELTRRLRALARAVSPEELGELWIFPPLSDMDGSAEFLLFTRRLERDRRRVYSARMAFRAENGGPEAGVAAAGNGTPPGAGAGNGDGSGGGEGDPVPGQRITEHGSVPSGRVHRLVDRFRRRLEDEGEPVHVVIDGRRERWAELVAGG